jgi:protein-tyrosine phosphatase
MGCIKNKWLSINKMKAVNTLIDIHSHILSGIDDGAKNIEQSLAMARAYVTAGVTHVFATPHHISGTAWAQPAKIIIQKTRELQSILQQKKIPLNLLSGMEISLHYHLVNELENKQILPLGNSNCYLLEPPFQLFRDDLLDIPLTFIKAGKCVILAHPERIPFFQKKSALLLDLAEQGVMLQVNIGSLLGKFGNRAKNTAKQLAENKCIHFIASDTHNPETRTPPTRKELLLLEKLLGSKQLQTLYSNNPNRLLGMT